MTVRLFLGLGALLAGLAVALGAFGAHGLESRVTPDRVDTFNTGVQYQMYHALALLAAGGLLAAGAPSGPVFWAGASFLVGTFFFSGSLYLLVLTDTPVLGAVAPIGGVAFIVGWGLLAWAIFSWSPPDLVSP
ncbi:MAG: DUF423 domain-containing protein [Longimonas sp.]|uniref:DUF423 domain-containing protein n=1 Tax=Longimonas sp. TaxID=2039626 RepID=UPI003976BB79